MATIENKTEEESTRYMDSAISNLFASFIQTSKKHDDIVTCALTPPHHVKLDYTDFRPEIQKIIKTHELDNIHTGVYWGLQTVIEVAKGHAVTDDLTNKRNLMTFEIQNTGIPQYDGKVFRRPAPVTTEEHLTGKQKIDNMANKLQAQYEFCTFQDTEELLIWTGQIYSNKIAIKTVKEEAEIAIPNCTEGNRLEIINKLKARTYADREDFDNNPSLITLENGVLDLDTMELKPHNPGHLSRVLLPRTYTKPAHKINDKTLFADVAKNLKDTKFWKFLTSSMTLDDIVQHKDIETLLEMLAAPLIKHQIDEKAFMHVAKGGNGKSIFLEYIGHFYGKTNGLNASLHDLATDRWIPAELDGKLYNTFGDISKYHLVDTSIIKTITGSDTITVQKRWQNPFSMLAFAKLIFSTNRFPKIYDQTEGFFRRWIIIEWKRSFTNSPDKIPNLRDILYPDIEEMNQVFSCIVYVAKALKNRGVFTHTTPWKTIQKEWNANANPVDGFYADCIKEDHNGYVTKHDTYQHYKTYALDKGDMPLSKKKFGIEFSEYADDDRTYTDVNRNERVWIDIKFKSDSDNQTTLKNQDDS